MTVAKLQHLASHWLDRLIKLSWTWKVTWAYLIFMLFLPLTAMFLKAGTVGWDKFWNIALSAEALSTYDVTRCFDETLYQRYHGLPLDL
jgi:sulfate/thiosulfate transport system permease protein